MKRPLQTAIYKYLDGEKTQERLTKVLSDATFEASKEFLAPFTEGALLTEKAIDLMFNKGRTAEGYPIRGWINNPQNFQDTANNIGISIKELGQTFIPGGARQIPPGVKAFTGSESEILNAITGGNIGDKEYEPATVLLANLGIRYEKIDVAKNFESKLKKYKYEVSEIDKQFNDKAFSGRPNGPRTSVDFTSAFNDASKRHYYAYKELKMAYDAVDLLKISSIEKKRILNDAGISLDLQASLRSNRNSPFLKNNLDSKLDRFVEENQQTDLSREALKYYITQQNSYYSKLPMLDLKFEDDSLLEKDIEFLRNPPRDKIKSDKELQEQVLLRRILKSTGGLVTGPKVSDTKEDPADRVDPFTGEPYKAQMEELGLWT